MVAVVYSGSKTAFWKITLNGKVIAHCNTMGFNPCFVDAKTMIQILNKKTALVNHAEDIKKIFFFAAGATSPERKKELANTLSSFFKYSKITVENDLYGAARAACFNQSGIVGMLGSGSNCAYFDGKKPQANNFGLGYILGDEGSSSYYGKMLLKDFLSKRMPAEIESKFASQFGVERVQIFERIYNKPQPAIFLTSFFDFIIQNIQHQYIIQLIDKGLNQYLQLYVLPIVQKYPNKELHFVGKVAAELEERLQIAAAKHQLSIKSITKEPILNLLKHYTN